MNRRLPVDAFDFYLSLGRERSYQTVATQYGVTKRAVTKLAAKEGWQARIVDFEKQARENGDKKAVETIEQMRERHLTTLKAVTMRAMEALSRMPLNSSMEAVRAIEMAIRQERLVRGDPLAQRAWYPCSSA
jgi:hypothetical protein